MGQRKLTREAVDSMRRDYEVVKAYVGLRNRAQSIFRWDGLTPEFFFYAPNQDCLLMAIHEHLQTEEPHWYDIHMMQVLLSIEWPEAIRGKFLELVAYGKQKLVEWARNKEING